MEIVQLEKHIELPIMYWHLRLNLVPLKDITMFYDFHIRIEPEYFNACYAPVILDRHYPD
jgi:hypothetical protein